MEPIHNFKDHRSLKGIANETIYFLNGCFYWATADRLVSVIIESVDYTNMGEPYRELARVNFVIYPGMNKEPLGSAGIATTQTVHDSTTLMGCACAFDIEMADAVRLDRYCQSIGYKLDVSAGLKGNREFMREANK
jgi:hypothetical protein